MGRNKEITNLITHANVADWISKGHTRQYCIDKLVENGMSLQAAGTCYYTALKELLPDPDLLSNYKQTLSQQNMDRLEKLIEDNIGGNNQDKQLALKAITELNKMCGAYGENSVMIAQNKDNEQVIKITFEK